VSKFGKKINAFPLTPEQENWFAEIQKTPVELNPMVRTFGSWPAGETCRYCALLFHNGRYLKCRLRKFTNGPGTDHRAGWNACAKFQPKEAT